MSQILSPVKQKKEVMLLNPVDHRYTPLAVDTETERVIYCKKHDGVLYRFFKLGPGWTGKDVRFLAVEGNPLVSYIKKEAGEDGVEKKVEAKAGFEEYLRLLWGDKAVNNLHPDLKKSIKESTVGTTVTVQPFIPAAGDADLIKAFNDIKAEGILYDADLDNLARMGEAKEVKKWQDRLFDKLPWVLAGIGATYILQGIGLIKGL